MSADTACPDRTPLLQAYVDEELDAANAAAFEAHLRTCSGCTAELARLQALRAAFADREGAPDLAPAAPAALRARIEAMIAAEAGAAAPVRRAPRLGWAAAGGGAAAVAASLALFTMAPVLRTRALETELVSSHVRSLLVGHVTDVQTSDRHLVKPWFNGRTDISPPVPELAADGFPLEGGRLDYIRHEVTPALVYRRRLHTVNVFVQRSGDGGAWVGTARREGYALRTWTANGLRFWAVSDISPAELEMFEQAFRRRAN